MYILLDYVILAVHNSSVTRRPTLIQTNGFHEPVKEELILQGTPVIVDCRDGLLIVSQFGL